MNESSKAVARRLHTPGFATHYFVGNGLDVGSGNDSLVKSKGSDPFDRALRDFLED
jgi:hypothetical protein